ncbi:ABC transporter related protein [Solidesulfovibrio fructosivorans JJ]]|uniref:ABC transporter related protein n=1 Tax=Solidesulfovibrio fructosivorans JJ] TaxID=596151 RepID=E1JV52_SOLFR|nr:ATP-binding cassette domain-containing protein [Solidesulfovibrio fructosivorans]EFL51646.1 ABC transporter related protein [Solidesulfovibrio fructosivorans JJ]]
MDAKETVLDVAGLACSLGDRTVLGGVDLALSQGDFAFLTGPSGSGKTTLLRLLHGSLPWQEGRGMIAGHDLSVVTPAGLYKLRRDVSMVFQDFRILPDRTVYDNVALPLVVRGMERTRLRRRVDSALLALELADDAGRLCAELPGGGQQRVAIARAVVAGPKIMLADEPTGNLDAALSAKVLSILRQFALHGTAVLMATHDRELMAGAPDALVFTLPGGEGEA